MDWDPIIDECAVEDDSRLGHLVDEVTRRLEAGERIDFEDLLRNHPRDAAQLRKLLPALEAMAHLASTPGLGTDQRPPSDDAWRTRPGVIGDYRILREIGRGGMGIVYEAEQRSLSRRVALKVLPLAAALDGRQFQRFQLEARAVACLHHQNIVPIFAVGTEDGVPYYAMQYIEGRSLAEVLRELRLAEGMKAARSGVEGGTGPQLRDLSTTTLARNLLSGTTGGRGDPDLPPAAPTEPHHPADTTVTGSTMEFAVGSGQGGSVARASPQPSTKLTASTRTRAYAHTVAGLGLQAAEALDHAHARGILHRDIKPANLLLDGEGRLWVADFGLAQVQGDRGLTLSGDILGTLRYMSPEQALGGRFVDSRTDIYSLGVTLYELLALRPAFGGGDRAAILRDLAEREPHRLRWLNPAVPLDLETIIGKATAKDPADRYATARDLADDLRRFLDDRPIAAARPGAWTRSRKWMLRHREATLAIVAVAVAAALLVGARAVDLSQRRIQLAQVVGRSLSAARASLQSDDSRAALRHLSDARMYLTHARDADSPLARELAQLSREVGARVDAEERFRRFDDLKRWVHSAMFHISGEHRARALSRCREALEIYGALGPAPWVDSPSIHALAPALGSAARDGIEEMLFLLGRLEVTATYNAADRARGHRRAIDALSRLDEALARPGPATALWMGWSWEALGDSERARRASRRARELASETALDDYMLGEYRYANGERDEALRCYTRALRRRPGHYLSIFGIGRALRELGRDEAAEAALTGAIALCPDAAIAYWQRGEARASQGKFDLALEDFRRMTELDPGDYLSYYGQAMTLERRGDYEVAVRMFDKAIALNPDSFSSRLNRGGSYARLGRLAEACADFGAVIERLTPAMAMSPREPNWVRHLVYARLDRARARVGMGRRNEALDDINRALEVDPKAANAYHCRATLVLLPAGQLEEAVGDLTRAIELEPDNPDHVRERASTLARLGRIEGALADLSRVIELLPKDPSGYLDRGLLLVRQGRHRDAVADAERALTLDARALTVEHLYNAACLHALARARASEDGGDPSHDAVARRYADRAMELLRRAVSAGWRGPRALETMRRDTDLDSIRDHSGFRSVMESARAESGDHVRQGQPIPAPSR